MAENNKLTPPFNITGLWVLREPFSVPPLKQYTSSAIRSFAELALMQIDVYSTVYAPKGLTRDVYNEDARNGAAIITLISKKGERVYVPDTYIVSYPNLGLDIYRRFVLSAELGVLPKDTQLDHLTEEIKVVLTKHFGRAPEVAIHLAGIDEEDLTPQEVEREEQNRNNKIIDKTTTYGRLYEMNKNYTQMQDYVQIMEQRIVGLDQAEARAKIAEDDLARKTSEYVVLKERTDREYNELVKLREQVKEQKARIAKLEKQVKGLGGQVN